MRTEKNKNNKSQIELHLGLNKPMEAIAEAHRLSMLNEVEGVLARVPLFFQAALNSAILNIHSLSQQTENYREHTIYQQCRIRLERVNIPCQSLFLTLYNEHHREALHAKPIDTNQILNFHSDELCIIGNSELHHQLKLESAFNAARGDYNKLLIDCGLAFRDKSSTKAFRNLIDKIEPGALALFIQDALNSSFIDKSSARMIYRFIGWRFFAEMSTLYLSVATPLRELLVIDCAAIENETIQHPTLDANKPENNNLEISHSITTPSPSALERTQTCSIKNLMSHWQSASKPVAEGAFSSMNVIDLNDLTIHTDIRTLDPKSASDLLSDMIKQLRQNPTQLFLTQTIRQCIESMLSNRSSVDSLIILDNLSENVLNLVSNLFNDISKNNLFIDEVANQISRIQLPIMQMALQDIKLFEDSQHPVRQYMSALGDIGVTIEAIDTPAYLKIESSITHLITDFEASVFEFQIQSEDLSIYLRQSNADLVTAPDKNSKSSSAINSRSAISSITKFLDSQDDMLVNPLAIHRTLRRVWQLILSEVLDTHGIYSREWSECSETYSIVLWSTQATANTSNINEIINQVPLIIIRLKKTFIDYHINPEIEQCILENLLHIHLQIMKGISAHSMRDRVRDRIALHQCIEKHPILLRSDAIPPTTQATNSKAPDSKVPSTQVPGNEFDLIETCFLDPRDNYVHDKKPVEVITTTSTSISHQKREINKNESDLTAINEVFAQINRLSLGTLFEIEHDGEINRYHLFQKSKVLDKYTFQHLRNHSMLVFSSTELASKICHHKANRIQYGLLFENALEKAVSTLQEGPPRNKHYLEAQLPHLRTSKTIVKS